MSVPLDEPLIVVFLDEGADYGSCLIECLEAVHIQALFLQRTHEPLNDTVALGLAHKCRARADPKPGELSLKLGSGVLRSPVMPEPKAQGYLGAKGSKVPTYTLADRLECCPAVSLLGDVVSHDLSRAVVNCRKEPAPALPLRVEARRIGAPELIRALGANRTAVRPVTALVDSPHRGKEPVLPHEAKDSVSADPNPFAPQHGPDLPVPLREERALLEHCSDLLQELSIGVSGLRASLFEHTPFHRRPAATQRHRGIDTRASRTKDRANQGERVAPIRRRAHHPSDLLSFLRSSVKPLFSGEDLGEFESHHRLSELGPGPDQFLLRGILAAAFEPRLRP